MPGVHRDREKSRRVRQEAGENFYMWAPPQGQMFEDYADHHTVIFEGFHGQLPFEFMLSLLDQFECLVQRSGGPC